MWCYLERKNIGSLIKIQLLFFYRKATVYLKDMESITSDKSTSALPEYRISLEFRVLLGEIGK